VAPVSARTRRAGAAFGLSEDFVLEVAVAPEALTSRLRASINQRPKRAFGVLKLTDEWVGVVEGTEFAVWERRQHATRAEGRIRGRRGGSRVEARIALTRRSTVLIVVFFALFMVGAVGSLTLPEGLGIAPSTLALAVAGGLLTLGLFWIGALRQRAALRAFLTDVFREREGA
jgi:hypothetical protein